MYYNRKVKKSLKKKVRLQKNVYVVAFEILTLFNMLWCSRFSNSLTFFYAAEIICLIGLVIYRLHFKFEGNELYKKSGIQYVDILSDGDFRRFIECLFKGGGYVVRESGCEGVDFMIMDNHRRYAVISKLSPIKVGMKAVNECAFSVAKGGFEGCYLITNNYLTPQAQLLATHSNITIINRTELAEKISADDVLSFINSSLYKDDKRCPFCGARLELNSLRTRYVCKNRPKCKYSRK